MSTTNTAAAPPLTWTQRGTVLLLVAGLLVGSFAYYRHRYGESKRLRIVEPGKLYRSGQLSAPGLEKAIRRFGIRTVINLREEAPNPRLGREEEARLCQRLGVRYVYLYCEDLTDEDRENGLWPESARLFLELVRRPENQPVLVHCQAGLHRTGRLCAVYRIAVQQWEPYSAWQELRHNGYGEDRCAGISPGFRDYLLPLLRHRRGVHEYLAPTTAPRAACPKLVPVLLHPTADPHGRQP